MRTTSIRRLRRIRAIGLPDCFCSKASSSSREASPIGGASCSLQRVLSVSNSINGLLCHFTKFLFDPVHFYPQVVLWDAQDIFHLAVTLVLKIEHRQSFFQFRQPVDGGIKGL